MLINFISEDVTPIKRVTTNEYYSPCPICGGKDRFRIWLDTNRYWCRQCQIKGDVIQYLRDIRGLSFHEASDIAGQSRITPINNVPANAQQNQLRQQEAEKQLSNQWIGQAESFLESCQFANNEILDWLINERGFSANTIKQYGIVYNPQNLFLNRKNWGLKGNKKLWVPTGIVLPVRDFERRLVRLRIRRFGEHPKYVLVAGSQTIPMFISIPIHTVIIVESELDAILLKQELGSTASVLALGTNSIKPTKEQVSMLRRVEFLFISLDTEVNQQTINQRGWWLKTFPQARWLPPVRGKDITEMFLSGIDLREWFHQGISLFYSPEQSNWFEMIEERMAILEYEAGFSRQQVEERIRKEISIQKHV